MNVWDVLILLLLAAALGLALWNLRRGRAGSCHGAGCGGSCAGCERACACENKQKPE